VGTHLSKRFGAVPALDDVSIELHPGSITAVLGPNGSGKSTLLKALSFLEPPDTGQIVLDGARYDFPVGKHSKAFLAWPTVTLVFQQLFLWPHLRVEDNVGLPIRGFGPTAMGERVSEILETFNLRSLRQRYPNELSLGQRQRVALARAAAVRPRYLLLDEVTSALDIEQSSWLLGYLRHLGDSGTAVLLVTHLVGFAKQVATEVLFMQQGRVLERGSTSILAAPGSAEFTKFLGFVK
jgi:ABC-type polar amino acid transport system ATPase subunit